MYNWLFKLGALVDSSLDAVGARTDHQKRIILDLILFFSLFLLWLSLLSIA